MFLFLSVLEWAALWTQPHTRLLGMGETAGVFSLLLHPALRNTRYALYVAKQTPGKYENLRGNTVKSELFHSTAPSVILLQYDFPI